MGAGVPPAAIHSLEHPADNDAVPEAFPGERDPAFLLKQVCELHLGGR
jgi:hypothetical protein